MTSISENDIYWRAIRRPNGTGRTSHAVIGVEGEVIAEFWSLKDARLFAAAPVMLKAIERARRYFSGADGADIDGRKAREIREQLASARAKAKVG